MNTDEMTTEQLKQTAKSLNIAVGPNIKADTLRDKIGSALMYKQVRLEEEARQKIRLEYEMKTAMAEIRETAREANVTLEYPDEPTPADIVRLKRKLGMEILKPRPSPETLAIEKSKRAFYKFTNVADPKLDVNPNVGGKYFFHLFPGKTHCLPAWVVKFWEKKCRTPEYKKVVDPVDGVEKHVRDTENEAQRWIFEFKGDAPDGHEFGIVI